MASHKMTTDAQGNTVYKVQASNGQILTGSPAPSQSVTTFSILSLPVSILPIQKTAKRELLILARM